MTTLSLDPLPIDLDTGPEPARLGRGKTLRPLPAVLLIQPMDAMLKPKRRSLGASLEPAVIGLFPGILTPYSHRGLPFPALRPVTLGFAGGVHQVTQGQSESGLTSQRLWLDTASGATLNPVFLTSFATWNLIRNLHKETKDNILSVCLPPSVYAGIDGDMADIIDPASGRQRWFFRGGPKMEWASPGVCRVSIALVRRPIDIGLGSEPSGVIPP